MESGEWRGERREERGETDGPVTCTLILPSCVQSGQMCSMIMSAACLLYAIDTVLLSYRPGNIESAEGEIFQIDLEAGNTYYFWTVIGTNAGHIDDTNLQLLGADGTTVLAANDNSGRDVAAHGSYVEYEVTESINDATVRVQPANRMMRGLYQLHVSLSAPDLSAPPPPPPVDEPVDCSGGFGDFGDCSEECGGGSQARSFVVSTPASNGGSACPDDETQVCNTQSCPCNSAPCQNEGACTEIEGTTYSCSCSAGYGDENCQTNIDECASVPCRNEGACTDAIDEYICICTEGYTGENCNEDINECSSGPCTHGGSCIDAVAEYTCNCQDGWSGDNCNTNIDECGSDPCQNEGTCGDEVNSYTCSCTEFYSGENCADEVDCPEGHRRDCRGLCAEEAWVGDGFCDDPYEGHHLNCEELEFDGGDCEGDPAEFVVDCLDQRAPTSWHGDGTCDNGIYAHNGRWINLNCASTGWDGGDCEHSPLNHMQCIRLIRSLDSCEATGDDGYRCESDECVQAIESLASGWDECVDLLGITQNILEQFQAVCGNCSPMPIFEACGLGVSFPDSRSPCNTEHCADTMVPWYTDDFTACEAEVVTMGASEQDLANLQLFYARCAQTQGR